MRRCACHCAPFVKNTLSPRRGRNPSLMRVDFGKSARFQNRFDQIRLIDHVGAKKGRAKFGHPRPIQPLGLCRQDVTTKGPHVIPQAGFVLTRGGFNRCHCAPPYRVVCATMRDGDGARP